MIKHGVTYRRDGVPTWSYFRLEEDRDQRVEDLEAEGVATEIEIWRDVTHYPTND